MLQGITRYLFLIYYVYIQYTYSPKIYMNGCLPAEHNLTRIIIDSATATTNRTSYLLLLCHMYYFNVKNIDFYLHGMRA